MKKNKQIVHIHTLKRLSVENKYETLFREMVGNCCSIHVSGRKSPIKIKFGGTKPFRYSGSIWMHVSKKCRLRPAYVRYDDGRVEYGFLQERYASFPQTYKEEAMYSPVELLKYNVSGRNGKPFNVRSIPFKVERREEIGDYMVMCHDPVSMMDTYLWIFHFNTHWHKSPIDGKPDCLNEISFELNDSENYECFLMRMKYDGVSNVKNYTKKKKRNVKFIPLSKVECVLDSDGDMLFDGLEYSLEHPEFI